MRRVATWSIVAAFGMLWASGAYAQAAKPAPEKAAAAATALPTADDLVEKVLTALGGRANLGKLQSRYVAGTVSMSIQGNDITGSAEIFAKAPNKTRTYMRMDLSQFGMGEVVVDQRCDGKTGYMINSMQGDREMTGDQLQGMLNNSFPTPLLNYKELGAKIEVLPKEKVGERDAFVVSYVPKAGPASKDYFDAENYLPLRTVTKVNVPEMGGEIEQVNEVSDYRVVDGVKIPFAVKIINPMQVITITMTKVEHNQPVDEAIFSKPVK